MSFVRTYVMIAKSGNEDTLSEALDGLAHKVRGIPGCSGVELYRDAKRPERFLFIERWESEEAQKSGGRQLGSEAFAPIMAALASPPESASLEQLLIL